MPERGYNAELNKWTAEQADVLNSELVRPHPSYWTDEVSITAAIVTATPKITRFPPAGSEAVVFGTAYGTGVYDAGGAATTVLIIPQVTAYTIDYTVTPNTVSFLVLLTAVNATATAPVPAGIVTYWSYNDFVDAALGNYTISTAPKIKFRVEMKP